MSFTVQLTGPARTQIVGRGIQFNLTVKFNAYVEGLTAVCLRHDVYLKIGNLPVLIYPRHGSFLDRHLWVESTVLEDGVVDTHAFNMSDKQLLIRRGEVVSFLMCL